MKAAPAHHETRLESIFLIPIMSISSRTRKILWARSGNLCALCRETLVVEGSALNPDSVVGDECHIVGEKPTAARGDLGVGKKNLDDYSNLILLCKIHHKVIDDQPEKYNLKTLNQIKKIHEGWVKETLDNKDLTNQSHFKLLHRIKSGKDLTDLLSSTEAYLFGHDEDESLDTTKKIAEFLQNIQDWSEIWTEISIAQRIGTSFLLNAEIKEIELLDYFVFGGKELRKIHVGKSALTLSVMIISVVRKTNEGITALGDLATLIC